MAIGDFSSLLPSSSIILPLNCSANILGCVSQFFVVVVSGSIVPFIIVLGFWFFGLVQSVLQMLPSSLPSFLLRFETVKFPDT